MKADGTSVSIVRTEMLPLRRPFWTCRKPDLERKNVLLCVDGSEPALRMADHVGFILAQERTQEVTLFVVVKPGEKASEGAEKIISVSKCV